MRIVAFEGHDGSGKTSIAKQVAERLGATYVKPFDGLLGDHIAWCWRQERFELANEVARSAVERQLQLHERDEFLVFDRHWMTMFTVVPRSMWSDWFPLPPAILCWTTVESTRARLLSRGEVDEALLNTHEHYCRLYREIAGTHGVPILDTTDAPLERSVARAVELVSTVARQV
jgi:hypothetical protein